MGTGRERAGHSHSLALSARQLAGLSSSEFREVQADQLQHLPNPLLEASLGPGFQPGNHAYVLLHRPMWEKTYVLNDVADAPSGADSVPDPARAPLHEDFT